MIVSLFRVGEKQPVRLLLGLVCVLTAGCGSDAEPAVSPAPAPAAAAPSVDEQVLLALDYYEPMYKVDAKGRVTNLRLTNRHLPTPVMAEVGKLTELQGIDAAFTTVTDEGLAQLKGLHKLRSFGLGYALITDEGLAHLEKLPRLQYVWLTKKNFSEEAIDKLKRARPDMNLYLH